MSKFIAYYGERDNKVYTSPGKKGSVGFSPMKSAKMNTSVDEFSGNSSFKVKSALPFKQIEKPISKISNAQRRKESMSGAENSAE